jgi:hypothetical protein
LASGVGEPPEWLVDDEHASPIALRAGEPVEVWVGFGKFKPGRHPELAQRVQLVLPTPGRERLELSQPGRRPVWRAQPAQRSMAIGAWVQVSADESALSYQAAEHRVVLDPIVLALAYGIGVRVPRSASKQGQDVVCCNLALSMGASWPLLRARDFSLAPYLGFEAALLSGDDQVTRRTWLGPALGLELSGPPLAPRNGPFPVVHPRSLLGASNVRLALVHWFGPDRSPPSFGLVAVVNLAYGN